MSHIQFNTWQLQRSPAQPRFRYTCSHGNSGPSNHIIGTNFLLGENTMGSLRIFVFRHACVQRSMGCRGVSQSSRVMWNRRVADLSASRLGVPVCNTLLLFQIAKSPRFHVTFKTCERNMIHCLAHQGVKRALAYRWRQGRPERYDLS